MFQFLKISPPHQKDTHSCERGKLHEHRKIRFIPVLPHFYHAIFCHIFFYIFFHHILPYLTSLYHIATIFCHLFCRVSQLPKTAPRLHPPVAFFFFGAREDGEITGQGRQELNGWSYVGGFLRGFWGVTSPLIEVKQPQRKTHLFSATFIEVK